MEGLSTDMCSNPTGVQGRISETNEMVTSQNVQIDLNGLKCLHADQSVDQCVDYEVRFCCEPSTSVLDVSCSHKYTDCGPLGAICDCDDVEANFDCTNSVGATCMCDSAWRMFPVTYDTPQDINGQPSPYTTICELVTGMNF